MAKHKQIVKELKRPDQFVDFWTRASQGIVTVMAPRKKPAIAAAVALVVVLVGGAIINYWDGGRRLAASRSLTRIQQTANAELLSDTSDGKDTKGNVDVPRFKTAAERQAAVLKEADAFLGGPVTAGSKALAFVLKGGALLTAGQYDDAVAAYQTALDGKLDARFRFLAHEGQGYAYEGKGDLDKALAAFAKLADDATAFRGFYQDRALFHKARLTEIKGDKSGALAIYRQILDKIPDTAMKDEITDRLALIEAK